MEGSWEEKLLWLSIPRIPQDDLQISRSRNRKWSQAMINDWELSSRTAGEDYHGTCTGTNYHFLSPINWIGKCAAHLGTTANQESIPSSTTHNSHNRNYLILSEADKIQTNGKLQWVFLPLVTPSRHQEIIDSRHRAMDTRKQDW